MTQADFFYRLTPDEILSAIARLGLEPSGHVAQLNSMENRVFDLRLDNGKHVVAKFYRPGRWSRIQILEEHQFLFDLAADEVPALAPLKFSGESLFEEQGIFFALWPRTGGREPEEFTEIDLQILGRLIARLHATGTATPYAARPRFSVQRFITDPLRILKEKKFLPEKFQSAYEEISRLVAENFETYIGDVPFLRIHGDLHKGNILNGSEGWFLLDFDDSLMGPAVQDIWMLFPGKSEEAMQARAVVLEAYREFRDFDSAHLALAEILRAMRIIHYSGWVANRYEDPAFKVGFPAFGDDAYWEEEIKILREICAEFGGNELSENAGEGLTNKDFFFDYEDQ